jgi:hypothetical protein
MECVTILISCPPTLGRPPNPPKGGLKKGKELDLTPLQGERGKETGKELDLTPL